jgi:hypothetical protein
VFGYRGGGAAAKTVKFSDGKSHDRGKGEGHNITSACLSPPLAYNASMPLSWNEIRQRAVRFSGNWKSESRESAERQTFWNEFFEVFGVNRRAVASYEEPVRKLSGNWGSIDLFWPGTLLVEHKSAGADLKISMPPPLVKAHNDLDRAAERCYRKEPFPNDRARVEFLFQQYETLTAPQMSPFENESLPPSYSGHNVVGKAGNPLEDV